MTTLPQTATTLQFSDDTFAQVDSGAGLVTIHRGQRTGADNDWGGQVIATLELDKLAAILKASEAHQTH
jgi:hypothetical protein